MDQRTIADIISRIEMGVFPRRTPQEMQSASRPTTDQKTTTDPKDVAQNADFDDCGGLLDRP